jgi:hypothetical protein
LTLYGQVTGDLIPFVDALVVQGSPDSVVIITPHMNVCPINQVDPQVNVLEFEGQPTYTEEVPAVTAPAHAGQDGGGGDGLGIEEKGSVGAIMGGLYTVQADQAYPPS